MFIVEYFSRGYVQRGGTFKRQSSAEANARRLVEGGADNAIVRDALGGLRFAASRTADGRLMTSRTPLGRR